LKCGKEPILKNRGMDGNFGSTVKGKSNQKESKKEKYRSVGFLEVGKRNLAFTLVFTLAQT